MASTTIRTSADVYRTVPLTGTPEDRDRTALLGKLLPMELHTDSQFRAYIQNRYVGARIHEAESMEEMILLYRVSIYGVKRSDFCILTETVDDEEIVRVWLCLADKGDTEEKWFDLSTSAEPPVNDSVGQWFPVTDGAGGLVLDADNSIVYVWIRFADISSV